MRHCVVVDMGGEYKGETYIWCVHDGDPHNTVDFEGNNLRSLLAFLREHEAL